AEVNENFDNLDQRLSAIENATTSTVNVDCSADSAALKNTTLRPNTTYVLTGICDGQIRVGAGLGTINIQGDTTGTMDDGITLQAGETDGDEIFAAIYGVDGVRLNLSNLTIDASAYNSSSDLYIAAVGSYRGAHVTLQSVHVVGGDEGLGAWNTGTFSVLEGNNISGFRAHGVISARASVVRIFDSVTVTGGSNQEGTVSEAVIALDGGVITARSETNITPATGPNLDATNTVAIFAFRNGTLRLNGGTLSGNLWSGESSSVDLRNITQSNGDIEPFRNGVMRIRNSNIAGASGDQVFVGGFSSLRLDSTVVNNVSGTGSIDTYRYGGIDIRGNSDLNGRDINCADPRERRIDGSVLNVGTTC
ncbi:MAG: hypothetical protein HKN34_03435, partial [Gammaproteobacteria bacterium]|nr:hypothetical protein [Gammaproteobacteria bacterium]